jgi:hypothetical protein
VLDRPLPETIEGLSSRDVPRIIAEILVFGKETDREARLELILTRDDAFEENLNTFLDVAGEPLGEARHERAVSQVSAATETLTTKWHLPADTKREHYKALMADDLHDMMMERWISRPLAVLGDKTPIEASSDPSLRVPLLAAILSLQLHGERHDWDSVDFDELRNKLGLPVPEPIDPNSVDVERIPLVRLSRLEVDQLSDDALITVYNRAVVKRASNAIRRFGAEMVARESLDERVDKSAVYGVLAQNAEDVEKELELIEKAKSTARAKNRSPAPYLIQELDVRIRQGNGPEVNRLISLIKTQYPKERAVQERLLRLLASHGLIRPDGLPRSRGEPDEELPPIEEAAPENEGGGLWTPDRDEDTDADASAEGASDKPQIWLPGMD